MITQLEARRIIRALYMLGFIFAIHSALPTYINSEFLSTFTGNFVGIIYAASSIVTIFAFAGIGKILSRFGDYKIILTLAFLSLASISGLIFFTNPVPLVVFFIILYVSNTLIAFNIDIFLESYSKDSVTGTIRGTFLTIANTAWIISPIIAGFILKNNEYWKVYLAAAILLIPVIFLLVSNFRNFKDTKYHHLSLRKMLAGLPRHKSTYKILMSNFFLQFFYAWMVIYTPIYLRTSMGFGWDQIGIIFTIMLFPFVLIEAPLGRLADKKWGEKEMLSIGFVILAVTTALLSFIGGPSFWLWAVGLFATRIGASMVEIMNETYFFKKNSQSDSDIIGLFRMTRPIAYIAAPIVATVLLIFLDSRFLFLALGIIMVCGLRYSLTLKDTL